MRHDYCILSGIYPPDTGGPAKFAATFADFLIQNNYSVRVISYTEGDSRTTKEPNLEVNLISRKKSLIFRYIKFLTYLSQSIRKKEKIIANGCFVEISILRLFFFFPYLTKVPGDIVWERARNNKKTTLDIDQFQTQKLDLKYAVFRFLFSFSLRKSQKVIVPSSNLRQLVSIWGISKENIVLIHNSIDLSKFVPSNRNNYEFDVVTVSRLVPWKGLEEVISICNILNLKLAIVGDGPMKSELEIFASKNSASVRFFGDVSQPDLVKVLQKSKIFVLNSSFEATSYALLEAMSCGLTPISNDSTGSAEVIQHKINGILCGNSTNIRLEEALKYLKDNPTLVESMSKNARMRIADNFNLEKNFEEIRKLANV